MSSEDKVMTTQGSRILVGSKGGLPDRRASEAQIENHAGYDIGTSEDTARDS